MASSWLSLSWPALQEADRLLICECLARRRHIPCEVVNFKGPFDPLAEFDRDDGTRGVARWLVCCDTCKGLSDPPLWECVFEKGLLHIADFHSLHT